MNKSSRVLVQLIVLLLATTRLCLATTYYVDCSQGTNGNGSVSTPWNTLSSPDSQTFGPGDVLLLRRGTTCNGQLAPGGSGTSSNYITVAAYSTGALPIINGGSNAAVVKLTNQSNWSIENLEITSGVDYGVYITASTSISGINLINLNVHGATGTTDQWNSGEVVVTQNNSTTATISNVTIDGVSAHDSHVAEGIEVNAGDTSSMTGVKGSNVIVENSLVHDVYADGIVILSVNSGAEQGNVVYNSGQCTTCTGSSPVGIWEFDSTGVVLQNNESYSNSSWKYDGGGFDLDYFSQNDTAQYNYAHDNQGYCLTALGSANQTSVRLIIRYNICSHNLKSNFQGEAGEIVVFTWNGGKIDGIKVYNNTLNFSPGISAPALDINATYTGTIPNFVKNNLVYASASEKVVNVPSPGTLTLDNNLYYTSSGSLTWSYNGSNYTSLSSYKTGTSQEVHSLNSNPLLNNPTYDSAGMPTTAFTLQSGSPAIDAGAAVCLGANNCSPGSRDFFGVPIPLGTAFDIGASEYAPGRVVNVDDSVVGSGTNQFDFAGNGWTNCTVSCQVAYPSMYAATYSDSSYLNDTVSVSFSGTQIALYGVLDVDGGYGAVSIDGGTATNVDFYGPSRQGNQLVWTSPFLVPGTHTLSVKVTETNDGNSSGYDVRIDRAEVSTASYYKVVSVLSVQDMSVSYCSTTSGEGIVQWDDSNGTCQQWEVTPATTGYELTNVNSGLSLTVPGSSTTEGTQLDQESAGEMPGTNQEWTLSPLSFQPFTYSLTNVNSGYLAGVSYGSLTEGEAIVQWASDGTTSQQWVFVPTN